MKRIESLIKSRTDLKEYVDRIQALIRTPEFKKDNEKLESLCLADIESDEPLNDDEIIKMEEEMEKKYGIHPVAVGVNGHINWEFYGTDLKDFLKSVDRPTVIVIEAGKAKDIFDENGKYIGRDYSPHLFNGRGLVIEIDLTRNRKVIDAEVKEQIDFYKKHVKFKKISTKGHSLSPWSVYDLHHIKGMNFSQIARKICGIDTSPAYDDRVMACYKNVKRAYKKATKMIEQASKKISDK